uniref:Adhesion G protein-coupled receptor F3b n=1 Tax=Monopterus albus TaxID=43700 RepID=A0A3Q3KEX9_MONAL
MAVSLDVSGNSTQMHYFKLTIEESARSNITTKLTLVNDAWTINDLNMTTICKSVPDTGTNCNCTQNHRWSDEVCQSNQMCCGTQTCIFPQSPSHMCVSENTVSIQGAITLKGLQYQGCLAKNTTEEFAKCNKNLSETMNRVFSTLRGFDILTITNYSVGSIIANFEVSIVSNSLQQDLIAKSNQLTKNLSALLNMETTGVVHLKMPSNPVCYDSLFILMCSSQEDLNTVPVWQLKKEGKIYEITTGTESEVMATTRGANVTLRKITELWKGEYTCTYTQGLTQEVTILHKASAVMDVSLLPKIDITTEPQFPRCKPNTDLVKVRVICDIGNEDNENYTVNWTSQNIMADIISVKPSSSSGSSVHVGDTAVNCMNPSVIPQVTCTFTNRCNQSRSASVGITIIYEKDQFCVAEGDWKDTKAGYTAEIKCMNATGKRQRKCTAGTPETWENEVSACVNSDLAGVLQSANIVDVGLGSYDTNAANVLSRLQNATNKTDTINTFANVNASVHVLVSLSHKLQSINNDSAVNDLLESSSNMLESSLEQSWKSNPNKDNLSLAEIYLDSVEQLIDGTSITTVKKKTNIEVAACSKPNCTNTVFNVSVSLGNSDAQNVTTAGFKQLENYWPTSDDERTPNSIIVSTTTDNKQLDSVELQIDFQLLKPRPRNVRIDCVAWDNATRTWSPHGCKWQGSSNEGRCVCNHLSSFAILMSRSQVKVPGINEMTYAGLSVSILSLAISLVIEVIVWSAVVKTSNSHVRHTAHINICLVLLIADCCFLGSSDPNNISEIWCKTLVVLKHFCYLSMFFWMLSLSVMLLHQTVFMFHHVSKNNYLRFSLVLGYVCPFLIVTITALANNGGAEGLYYSRDTCWLIYDGLLKGSIHTFFIPVGVIVFINIFSMGVVILKLLDHPVSTENFVEKTATRTVIRSVILYTPIFGVTWLFGFGVMALDLTSGNITFAVHYAFTLLNAFQVWSI